MPPKGKQGTRGMKQIAEENQSTLKFYLYVISGVNTVFYLLYYFLFWESLTTSTIVLCALTSVIYFSGYSMMNSMATATYDERRQLVAVGGDLNMEAGMAEHLKDLILLTAISQASSLVSNYFWLLLLAAPGRALYMLWVNFLGPWFFAPAPEEDPREDKKQKKMERRMKRQQMGR